MELTIGLAFAAGFISFISPCVLPLVPAYITYMGGRMTHTVAAQASGGGTISQNNALARVSTGMHSLFFILGFTLVFVGFGLILTTIVQVIGGGSAVNAAQRIIGRVGGIVIIVFGLHFMGALSNIFNAMRKRESMLNIGFSIAVALAGSLLIFWAFDRRPSILVQDPSIFYRMVLSLPVFTGFILWLLLSGAFTKPKAFWLDFANRVEYALYADTRQQMAASGQTGFGGSLLMGIVFAAGWTPCIGPIYGAILTLANSGAMASNGGQIAQAGLMLTAYSLGLGVPFIVTALLLDGAQGFLRRLNRHMGVIKAASGIFLIAVGVLIASGQLQRISQVGANGELSVISYRLEECFTEAISGDIAWGQFSDCTRGVAEFDETAGAAEVSAIIEGSADINTIAPPSIEAAAGGSSAESTANVGTSVGNIAPNFESFTADGEAVSLDSLRGQVVLVNFWATWCGPCRVEMPEFQAAFDDHGDDGFTILAVNNQENAEQVQQFRDELDLTFPLVMDLRGNIQQQYNVLNYPSTYLIGTDGTILDVHLGPLTSEQISEMLGSALNPS